MDGRVPQDSTAGQAAIEVAARNMGIVPGDPAYPFVQFMLRLADDAALDRRGHEVRIGELLDRAERQAGGQIARAAIAELPYAIDKLVLVRHRRLYLLAGIILLAVLISGIGIGRYLFAAAPRQALVTDCVPSPQPSGEAFTCTFWTHLPTERTRR
jgi:hypothetical protein